ncbi:MAG: pyridoxamine 5'-phosphate oxidase [Cellvibrionaceae bacterium]|nr:pyridoxamine 5'-phosphate oxidase [Cellvibrionaceae bacterium]|tara:strand:- start:18556 stop:19104 length:549 start_codon:yes stop_codon:yes gene_type:complete
MAEQFPSIEKTHQDFIERQQMFFVATAASEGRVNLSPKGMDSFRVLGSNRIAWLNLTGSGNETAAHLRDNNRMTVMFCSFDKQPLILRLYGKAKAFHENDEGWDERASWFPASTGARQVYEMEVDLVQNSCGFAVPRYAFEEQRPTLKKWADNQSRDQMKGYWDKKNRTSIDGFPTGIEEAL